MRGIHVNRRCLEHLAGIHTLGHVTRELGAESSEFVDKVVKVSSGSLGSMIPRQEEFVLNKWRWNWGETNVSKVVVAIVYIGNAITLWCGGVCGLDKQRSKIAGWRTCGVWSGRKEFDKFVGEKVRNMRWRGRQRRGGNSREVIWGR